MYARATVCGRQSDGAGTSAWQPEQEVGSFGDVGRLWGSDYQAMYGGCPQRKPTAQRLCMERLLPPCKPLNNRFRLPAVKTAADLGPAWQSVAKQVALGKLSAQDGEAMASMLDMRRKAIESEQLAPRPAGGETAADLSLLTEEQLAQAKELGLAATKKKDQ